MTTLGAAYEQALVAPRHWRLRTGDGAVLPVADRLRRWRGQADETDRDMLRRCQGTVLDVGCGPGRLVSALHVAGVEVLGVDVHAGVVGMARARGAPVVLSSVFDTLPAEGSWGTVLLADGNIGIGGDPRVLLRRCADLLAPAGRIIVEVGAPGSGVSQVRMRLESSDRVGAWFRWAHVAADLVHQPAAAAGLSVGEVWQRSTRWFAVLAR